MGEETERKGDFTPSPLNWVCPKCKSYYPGKTLVLDFKDPEYVAGKRETPPTIMALCHGLHPQDPYQEKK